MNTKHSFFPLPFFLLRITEQIHQSLSRLHTEAKEPKTEKTDEEETPAPLLFSSANQWTREVTSPSENQASGEVNKESAGTGAKQQSTDIPAAINRKKKHTHSNLKKNQEDRTKAKGNPRQDNAPQEHAEGGDGGVEAGVGVGVGVGVSAKLDDDRLPRNAGGSGA